jgi:hypothetical protein
MTTTPNKTLRIETPIALWCYLVLIARKMTKSRRKSRRAGWLSGLISLYRRVSGKGRRVSGKGRRVSGRSAS